MADQLYHGSDFLVPDSPEQSAQKIREALSGKTVRISLSGAPGEATHTVRSVEPSTNFPETVALLVPEIPLGCDKFWVPVNHRFTLVIVET